MRENREDNDEYVVPHGDWFQYVSSPHYLAEIVTSLSLTNVLGVFISCLSTLKKLTFPGSNYKFLFAVHLYLRLYMLALWLLVGVRTSQYGYSGDSRYNSIQNLEKYPHFPTLCSFSFCSVMHDVAISGGKSCLSSSRNT